MPWVERHAARLYPHRLELVTAGLACFLVGSLPLAAAAREFLPPAEWQLTVFAASAPLVLWSLGLAVLATFFHPSSGLVGSQSEISSRLPAALRRLLRGYAFLTVCCFALAPVAVFLAA